MRNPRAPRWATRPRGGGASGPEPAAGPVAEPAAAPESVLSVRDLSVAFPGGDGGRTVHAVDGVSLELRRGEVLAVVGESGCGKSVTAMAVLGLLPATTQVSGSVRLAGRELAGAPERELRQVRGRDLAMIFQEPMTSLNPVLTVGRQIGEVLRRHQGLGRRQARERAVELLELVGIPAARQRVAEYPHQLSGGMRQRVMIAIAVACDPAVLIADEPTTALDVTVQAGVLEVLAALRERLGTAQVLITHDLGVVAETADRVLVMYAGRPVEQAPVAELFAAPRHPYTRGLLDAVPRPGTGRAVRLREIPGLVPDLTARPDRCTFAPRCGAADEECTASRPPLEQAGPAHRVACRHPVPAPAGSGQPPDGDEVPQQGRPDGSEAETGTPGGTAPGGTAPGGTEDGTPTPQDGPRHTGGGDD